MASLRSRAFKLARVGAGAPGAAANISALKQRQRAQTQSNIQAGVAGFVRGQEQKDALAQRKDEQRQAKEQREFDREQRQRNANVTAAIALMKMRTNRITELEKSRSALIEQATEAEFNGYPTDTFKQTIEKMGTDIVQERAGLRGLESVIPPEFIGGVPQQPTGFG